MTTNKATAQANADKDILLVMRAAEAIAKRLVQEGTLAAASFNGISGESSCITLTVREDLELYLQPMYPDDEDGEYVELYLEREDPEWEPVPFDIYLGDQIGIENDIEAMFDDILRLLAALP